MTVKSFEELQQERKARINVVAGKETAAPEVISPPPQTSPPAPLPQGEGSRELAAMVSGISVRAKYAGAVMQFQLKTGTDPAEFLTAAKASDPSIEFETELRRDFGQRGDLKRATLQTMSVVSRGDKVTLDIIAANGDGKQVPIDAWMEPAKAIELLGTLDLTDEQARSVDVGLSGKEKGVLSFIGSGVEVSYRESERDGKVTRRLAEFHKAGVAA